MQIAKIKVKGLRNTRDLGQLKTKDGHFVKKDVLFRSGRLDKVKKKRLITFLKEYQITRVIDLRTSVEANEGKDLLPEEVSYYHVPLLNDAFFGITHEKKMSKVLFRERKRITKENSASDYMIKMYESIVSDPNSIEQIRIFFNLLLEEHKGATLFHCTGGKDRTGIAAILLLAALGVDIDEALQDYAASDYFNRKYNLSRNIGINIVLCLHPRFRKILLGMLYAKRSYMEKTIEFIANKYGSLEFYLTDIIKLDEKKRQILKEKYLI